MVSCSAENGGRVPLAVRCANELHPLMMMCAPVNVLPAGSISDPQKSSWFKVGQKLRSDCIESGQVRIELIVPMADIIN